MPSVPLDFLILEPLLARKTIPNGFSSGCDLVNTKHDSHCSNGLVCDLWFTKREDSYFVNVGQTEGFVDDL